VREAAVSHGRNPDDLLFVGAMHPAIDTGTLRVDLDALATKIEAFHAGGTDHIILVMNEIPAERFVSTLRHLAAELLPRLKHLQGDAVGASRG